MIHSEKLPDSGGFSLWIKDPGEMRSATNAKVRATPRNPREPAGTRVDHLRRGSARGRARRHAGPGLRDQRRPTAGFRWFLAVDHGPERRLARRAVRWTRGNALGTLAQPVRHGGGGR